jgi:hypothetical protein
LIFLNFVYKSLSKNWVTILKNQTAITFYILNNYTYTPFKKKLKYSKFLFTANQVKKNNLPDKYNKQFIIKKFIHYSFNSLWEALKSIIIPYWARVVFKGKGFRMRKFKNSRKLTFNFGHSHWTKLRLRTYFIIFKRKRRQSQYFFCYSSLLFKRICLLISFLRKINKYTKRGLRLKKQSIIRRFGKISQMLSAHNY